MVKISILGLLFVLLYHQITQHTEISAIFNLINTKFSLYHSMLLGLVVVLMLLNWGLEAFKWQFLVKKIAHINFFSAFKAVFFGIALSVFMPNRIGEQSTRVLLLKNEHKAKALSLALLGSTSQLVANLWLTTWGFIGFFYYYMLAEQGIGLYVLGLSLSVLGLVVGTCLFFNVSILQQFVSKHKKMSFLTNYIKPIGLFSQSDLWQIVLLSACRNMVYTFQYLLLMWALAIPIDWLSGLLLINSIFFVQTLLPSIALLELGVRGNVALFFMAYVNNDGVAVVAATFMLWIINLMLPALIGGWVIWQKKMG